MFSGVTKTGHPRAEVAKEATREAIARSKKILLHVDRPGYDLQLIHLPADGQPQTVSLNRLEEPSLTIIVDSIAGNKSLAERLRSKLRDSGLAVGSPKELEAKRGAYIESKAPDLTPYQRLTKLREARADALVSGSSRSSRVSVGTHIHNHAYARRQRQQPLLEQGQGDFLHAALHALGLSFLGRADGPEVLQSTED